MNELVEELKKSMSEEVKEYLIKLNKANYDQNYEGDLKE